MPSRPLSEYLNMELKETLHSSLEQHKRHPLGHSQPAQCLLGEALPPVFSVLLFLTLVLCSLAPNSDTSSTWPLAPSTPCPGSPHSLVSLFTPCASARRSITLSATSLAISHVILGFMVMAGKPTALHPH